MLTWYQSVTWTIRQKWQKLLPTVALNMLMPQTLCLFFTPVVQRVNLKVLFMVRGGTCFTQRPHLSMFSTISMMMYIGVQLMWDGLQATVILHMAHFHVGLHKLFLRVFHNTQRGVVSGRLLTSTRFLFCILPQRLFVPFKVKVMNLCIKQNVKVCEF